MNAFFLTALSIVAASCSDDSATAGSQASELPQVRPPAPVVIQSNRLTDSQAQAVRDVLAMRCNGGHGPSCADLANMYRLGVGGSIDLEKSKVMSKRACDLGFKDSCP